MLVSEWYSVTPNGHSKQETKHSSMRGNITEETTQKRWDDSHFYSG